MNSDVLELGAIDLMDSSITLDSKTLQELPRLRILQVSARYPPFAGGTETHTFEVSNRLVERGHAVTVLTANPDKKLEPLEEMNGVQAHRIPVWPARGDYYVNPQVYEVVRAGQWDVVHCQGYHTFMAPAAMLTALRSRTPYFVSFHSGGHSSRLRTALRGVQRQLLRPLLARAQRLIAVSKFEMRLFRDKLSLPHEKFAIIPNGGEIPRVPSDLKEDLRRANGTLILSVGRLERYKGHQRVIAAMPQVLERVPDARLRIVGTGAFEKNLRAQARELGIEARVEIAGIPVKNRWEIATLLASGALVVLLSEYEAHAIAIMEALVVGRPVLVLDTAGLHDMVEAGLVRGIPLSSTSAQVAQAIIEELDKPMNPAKLKLPTWDDCVDALSNLYYQAASHKMTAGS